MNLASMAEDAIQENRLPKAYAFGVADRWLNYLVTPVN
jgi:hypothetical protein